MNKSPDAFRTISEVAEDLGLPQHVLRFWETRFSQIKPMKRGGGRRYYRPDDVDLLRGIQCLLYEEGYTIKGVQRILKENGNKYVIGAGRGEDLASLASANPARGPDAGGQDAESQSEDAGKMATGKKAVPVAQIMQGGENSGKGTKGSKGLFKRLVGKEAEPETGDQPLDLSASDKKQLQSTLVDLLECKRLLDQAR